MHHSLPRIVVLVACCVVSTLVRAATIYQAASSTYVVFEAENIFSISNNAPSTWVFINDAAVSANGGQALHCSGTFGTTNA